jgi:hypothetical protein
MLEFAYHRTGYNVGVVILGVSTALTLVSFGAPFWFTYGQGEGVTIGGTRTTTLWSVCVKTSCYFVNEGRPA